MMTPEEIEDQSDRTLHSLDHVQRAEANPYLFGKVKNRLIQQRQQTAARQIGLMLRLSAVLLLFVAINLSSYYLTRQNLNDKQEAPTQAAQQGIDAVRAEYFATDNAYSY